MPDRSFSSETITAQDLASLDSAHHFHPFTDHRDLYKQGGARSIVSASGVWLEDAHGNKLLDAMSGLWCVNVGYGRQEIVEAAARQMSVLPYYNTFFKTTTIPAVRLAKVLASFLPAHFSRVFFTGSGSEANETMIRFVRHYWELKGKKYRKHFISRWRGYHGSTLAAASLGGMSGMHKQGGLPLPGFHHIVPPCFFDYGKDLSEEAFGEWAALQLEEKILELGPENVAAFVGEPIQGAGGVIIPPKNYWPKIEEICRKYGILLVSDEVICGFGRTGNFWGYETMGYTPDIVVMAKGLSSGYMPIGAVAFSDALFSDFSGLSGEFSHGYTYSGHPVACATALANIAILEQENLIERVASLAPFLREQLSTLADHPLVGEIRTEGLIGAIELVKNQKTKERFPELGTVGTLCRDACFSNDLVMRACWDTMVFAPPFIISEEEIALWMKKIRQAFDLTIKKISEL